MSKKGSVWTWVAVALVALLVLGAGAYFGFTRWTAARSKAAVEAAAAFQEAVWTQDSAALEDLLPPELVSAMSETDIEGVTAAWSLPCTLDDVEWSDDEYTAVFTTEEWTGYEGTVVTLEAVYDLPPATTESEMLVEGAFTITGDALPDSLDDSVRIDVVWLDGAWRVARYRFEGTYSADIVFYRDGRSAEKVLAALRETLGIDAGDDGTVKGDGASTAASDPTQLVGSYYDAVIAGDYAKAFAVLPEEKQAGWGDVTAFGEAIGGYGITAYTFSDARVDSSDGTTVITVTATTVAGDFSWEWRLKKQGTRWVAVGYALASGESVSGTAPQLSPDELQQGELPAGHPDLSGTND